MSQTNKIKFCIRDRHSQAVTAFSASNVEETMARLIRRQSSYKEHYFLEGTYRFRV